jgi:hypothetical protein
MFLPNSWFNYTVPLPTCTEQAPDSLPHIISPISVPHNKDKGITEHTHCKTITVAVKLLQLIFLSYEGPYLDLNLGMGFTLWSSSLRLIMLAVSSFIAVGISSEAMRASARPNQSPAWPRSPGNPESSSHSQWRSYNNYFMIFPSLHSSSHWQSLRFSRRWIWSVASSGI